MECLAYSKENFVSTHTLMNVASADASSCSSSNEPMEQDTMVDAPTADRLNSEDMDVDADKSYGSQEEADSKSRAGWVDWQSLPNQQEAIDLAFSLGQCISADLYEDGKSQEYTKCNMTQKEWLQRRNPLLLSFLAGCTGVTSECVNKKVNALVHWVERILYACNLIVVTPFAFIRNLTQYAATKSKVCASLMGSWEPAGSYTTLHNFTCSPVDPSNCPFDDIHGTIDNNQKIWKVIRFKSEWGCQSSCGGVHNSWIHLTRSSHPTSEGTCIETKHTARYFITCWKNLIKQTSWKKKLWKILGFT